MSKKFHLKLVTKNNSFLSKEKTYLFMGKWCEIGLKNRSRIKYKILKNPWLDKSKKEKNYKIIFKQYLKMKKFLTNYLNMAHKKKYSENKLIDQFIFDSYRKKILPKVVVDYNRQALLSKNGLYFRLTFDSDIKSCSSQNLFEKEHEWKLCIPGNDILEVKFDLNIPPWFHRIIQNYQLKRISVSKFVLGMESTNLAHDYEGI